MLLLLGALHAFAVAEIVKLVDDFESKRPGNQLNGITAAWQKNPRDSGQYCRVSWVDDDRDGGRSSALRLLYSASSYEYTGYSSKLNGFDIRPYQGITFWARGGREFEPVPFKVEFRNNYRSLYHYVFNLTRQWQKITIPFTKFSNFGKIDEWDNVSELVFVFEGRSTKPVGGCLYLDDVGFYSSDDNFKLMTARIKKEDELKKAEFERIAALPDDELLDFIERKTFGYFWDEASPYTYLVLDRSTLTSAASTGATGFGLTALCIGTERRWISRSQAERRVLKTLEIINNQVEGKNGFYYHFVKPHDGRREGTSEISSVDTALLLGGVLTCREYFSNNRIKKLADEIFKKIDWQWMLGTDPAPGTLLMGWDPEYGFEKYIRWDMFAEGTMMYLLAMGSPTHPLPPGAWDAFARPVKDYKGEQYMYHDGESMFVYAYSHSWVDYRNKHDKYADYWQNSASAVRANKKFCENYADRFKTYRDGYWGISASDGPDGYAGYGAVYGMNDGTIPPYSLCMSVPLAPDIALPAIRKLLREQGPKIWGRYGFVSAFNLDRNWFSTEHVGIDEGIILQMIENYRSGFVWKYFMRNPYIKAGMRKAGFENGPRKLNFAYLQELQKKREKVSDTKILSARRLTPSIDGNLSEWEGNLVEFDADKDREYGSISSPADFAAAFGMTWDDKNLYFAANVTDNKIVARELPAEIYKGDCIELYLDTKTKGKNFLWGDKEYYQIGFAPDCSLGKPVSWSWFQGGEQAQNVKMIGKRAENGYTIEASISMAFIAQQARAGEELGMSVSIHDLDAEKNDGTDKKLTWCFKKVGSRFVLGTVTLAE
jgi:hypothetical protein